MTDYRFLLNKSGFRHTKSLGQNFIYDMNLLEKIAESAGIGGDSNVLEIGSGAGTLTSVLCGRAGRVLAVEIDKALEYTLRSALSAFDNCSVVFGDCLKLDLRALCREHFGEGKVDVVANLPYYITTPIIMRLLEDGPNLNTATVMVQREVAKRIAAKPGGKDYGVLTVAVQSNATAEIVMDVPAGAFTPVPGVDSCVVKLTVQDAPRVAVDRLKPFMRLVRAAFHMRRKTLVNNLLSAYPLTRSAAEDALGKAGIKPTARAEELSIEEYGALLDVLAEACGQA